MLNTPLFYPRDAYVEKTAGEVDLPDDPNQWAQQVLQELYKQVPYITDYQPHVEMQRTDAEQGYGLGHVAIQNQSEAPMDTPPEQLDAAGIRSVRIPFVIREKKLSPFDLLINDTGSIIPLTENRLRQSLFRPQAFDVTSRTPGDQSMIGQLYPPYRQNYGFGGGGIAMTAAGGMGIGKVGSALEEYLNPDRVGKTAAVLTQEGREHIKPKNFAIPKGNGPGGTGKYPIHDETHARAALSMVAKHGTPGEKAKVDAAVAKKYPGLAARSSVPAVRAKAERKKEASILLAILPTLDVTDSDRVDFELKKIASELYGRPSSASSRFITAVDLLLTRPGETEKYAAWEGLVRPNVVQIQKLAQGYLIKTANSKFWDPKVKTANRGDVVRTYGAQAALQADLTGCCTLASGLKKMAQGSAEVPAPIEKPGMYKVVDTGGAELIGFVTPSLVGTDGNDLSLAFFTNGSAYAAQQAILGVPAASGTPTLPEGPIGSNGLFYSLAEGGAVRMTVPMTLQDSSTMEGQPRQYNGVSFSGEQISVSLQPNVVDITPVGQGKIIIPATWKWLPLDNAQQVQLMGAEQAMGPEQAASLNPAEKLSHVEVVTDGESFSLRGVPLTKIAADQRSWLSLDDTMFLLAGLGVDLGQAAVKLAEAAAFHKPTHLAVSRTIDRRDDLLSEAMSKAASVVDAVAGFKQPLFLKEAASFPDPQMVDTVLSLGFINPENIMTFVSYLPDIEDVQTKMCELLFAVRLGLSNVPQSALERSVRSTEEVIEGLKVLGFQGA